MQAEELIPDVDRIAASWGSVALLFNPERKVPAELPNEWAKHVAGEPGYGNVDQAAEEGRPITNEGLLQIDWPSLVDGWTPVDLDLLLVTAKPPTLSGTPLSCPNVEAMPTHGTQMASRSNTSGIMPTTESAPLRKLKPALGCIPESRTTYDVRQNRQ